MKNILVGVGLATCIVAGAWLASRAKERPENSIEKVSCHGLLPETVDPARLVILQVAGSPARDPGPGTFREDIEELLLAGQYQVLSADSQAALLPLACVPWKIDLDLDGAEDGVARVAIRRYGLVIVDGEERGHFDRNFVGPEMRRTIAQSLTLAGHGVAASLWDPDSVGFHVRRRAMRLLAAGRSGEAARLLASLEGSGELDAASSFRLGRIYVSWGGEMLATSGKGAGQKSAFPALGQEAERLLAEGKRHLERSLELQPESPLALFARGQARLLTGEASLAEGDFSRAAKIWPAFGEAVNELAQLRLARGDVEELLHALPPALRLVDVRDSVLRARLLKSLGEAQLQRGISGSAGSFRLALETIPVERRRLRLETLYSLARAEAKGGEWASFCTTLRSIEELDLADKDRALELGVEQLAACP